MKTIAEVRQQFPQHDALSDSDFVEQMRQDYYPNMKFGEFANKIGYVMPISEMPEEARTSAGEDVSGIASGLWDAVTNPTETIHGGASLLSGAANNAMPWLADLDAWMAEQGLKQPSNPEVVGQQRATASDVGASLADTLTTKEGFKRYISNKPVSALSDVLSAGTSGAAIKTLKTANTAGKAAKTVLRGAPSADDVAARTNDLFDIVKAKDTKIPAADFTGPRDKLIQYLDDESIDAAEAPKAMGKVAKMDSLLPERTPNAPTANVYGIKQPPVPLGPDTRTVPFNRIESVRRGAGRVIRDDNPLTAPSGTDKMVAGKVKDTADEMYRKVPDPTFLPDLEKAREMGRRNVLIKKMDEMERKAEQGYVQGEDVGWRNQAASFLKKHGDSLTEEEVAAFKNIKRREGVLGLASTLGGGLGKLAAMGVGAGTGGVGGLLAGIGLNAAAGGLANWLTKVPVAHARKVVLMGPDGQKIVTTARKAKRKAKWVRRTALTTGAIGAANRDGDEE
jgi:hypothetical protein